MTTLLKENVKELTIEELQEIIELLIWENGVIDFEIAEISPKGRQVIKVNGLHLEFENDVVNCWDWDNEITNKGFAIMGFILDNLVSIKQLSRTLFELNFKDVQTIIKAILP